MKVHKIPTFWVLLGIVLFWEIVYKIAVFDNFFNIGLLYMILFTIPIIFIFTFLLRFFSPKVNKILLWIFITLLTIIYIGGFVFITLFSTPFSFSTVAFADQAADNFSVAIKTISKHLIPVSLMLLPVIILIIFQKRISFDKFNKKMKIFHLVCFIVLITSALLFLLPGKKELYSSYKIFYEVDAPNLLVDRFGVLTSTFVDLKRVVFGFEEKFTIDDIEPSPNINKQETDPEMKYNITDIDFDLLIESESDATLIQMHEYFKNEEPTNQNIYTGLFKDKNLIFIVAEGFNNMAVFEDITPTLYKLSNSSFVFENFYTPVILSTVGGEMQALLGLVPTMETINIWKTFKPSFPYAIGNAFSNIGYTSKAYHNHSYTYYQRDITRPTIGFSDYMGCGNGLEKLMPCKTWPNSDIDLIEAIEPIIIGSGGKHATYILTVSGHANYSWGGNYIARKNRELVKNLPYSDEIKGYLATQIELDKALELLIKKLEAAGEIENTVIALVGDHYPYNFTIEEVNELSTYKRDKIIEVNRSNFILWNPLVPKTTIKKVASQIDVLPTILNLFGIEYDSRIIIGKDILSDAPGLAMFSNRSWVSDYGRYTGGTFTQVEGEEIGDEYVSRMNKIVANKFSMSTLLMKKDYYKKVIK